MKKFYFVLLVLLASFGLFACADEEGGSNKPGDRVRLNVAVNFDNKQYISYSQTEPYIGLDGKKYSAGELSPTWSKIGENLNIDLFDEGYRLKSKTTQEQWENAKLNSFKGIDLINSNGVNITSERNNFVNLKPYIDKGDMPNLAKFLKTQSTFESYMTADDGGIYYTPYLDGNEEAELGFLMRIDWTEKIVDSDLPGDEETIPTNLLRNSTPFNPATLNTKIKVAEKDAGSREVIIKYEENILTQLINLGPNATGKQYLDTFRAYMISTHDGQGYAKLSDVFVGYDSGYLVDELVALMAVVKANPKMLTRSRTDGKPLNDVSVYFPREAKGSRMRNMFRGLEMYGLRGAVSKNNWLYMDDNGKLTDSRATDEGIAAIGKLNDMYKDGLIIQNPEGDGKNNWRDTLQNNANGFLMYDYNATQTAQSNIDKAKEKDAGYKFQSILPPVNAWKNSTEYIHFSESTRSLKNEAWGITKQVENDPKKLAKAIELVDYLYDTENGGADLFLFGPEEWRSTETIDYQGEKIPKFSEKAIEEINDPEKGKGKMIDYLRDYVGSTLPIGHVRSLGLEIQTLTEDGMAGYLRVSNAVEAGVLLLAGLQDAEAGKWFNLVPNVFPLDANVEDRIKGAKQEFDDFWGDGELYTILKNGLPSNYKADYIGSWYNDLYIKHYQSSLDNLLKLKELNV